MPDKIKYCKNHDKGIKTGTKKKYGLFAGLLLVILPKCPFCIMAYSGTVMLCGKDTLIENQQFHNSPLSIILALLFCSLIVPGLLLNFRGTRTKFALALAGSGIFLILNSVIRNGGQELYYLGVSIVFIAIWLNGNLVSVLRKLNNTLFISKRNAPENP
jgi:hypothetical protein